MNLHIYFDIGQNLLVIGLILHCQKKRKKNDKYSSNKCYKSYVFYNILYL